MAASPETTRIGGHTYAFPATAFVGGQAELGPVGTFLIELAWPEMAPRSAAERAVWPPRDTIRVLANSAAPTNGEAVPEAVLTAKLPEQISAAVAPNDIAARAAGRPPPLRLAPGMGASGAIPGGGMLRVQVEPVQPADATQYDVFVRGPIANPQEFIQCARERSVSVPDCAQSFVAQHLILKVSYRRKLVTQWRDIHARVLAFLQDHEVAP